MNYTYHTAQGNAVLCKGDDYKLVQIGKFANESQARQACEAHYKKACNAAANFGRTIPTVFFA